MKTKIFKVLDRVASILVLVGGVNWLLVPFQFNLVSKLLMFSTFLQMLVYGLVGVSALYIIVRIIQRKFMKKY